MEFKGTKGEWSTENRNDKYDRQATIRINSSFGVEGLCTIWSGTESLDEMTIADAQLISAAPDLLQAAMDFIEKVDNGKARSTDSYNKFKIAVNKALGNVKES